MDKKYCLPAAFKILFGLMILSPIYFSPWTPTWPVAIFLLYMLGLMIYEIIQLLSKSERGTPTKQILRAFTIAMIAIGFYLLVGIIGARGSYPGTWLSNVLRWNGEFDYLESDGMRLEKLGV